MKDQYAKTMDQAKLQLLDIFNRHQGRFRDMLTQDPEDVLKIGFRTEIEPLKNKPGKYLVSTRILYTTERISEKLVKTVDENQDELPGMIQSETGSDESPGTEDEAGAPGSDRKPRRPRGREKRK